MTYTLYTDAVSNKYKELAADVKEKIISLNEYINIKDVSELVVKYSILATEYDNIANNRLSDTDYLNALRGVDVIMKNIITTQTSYVRDLYAELNENISFEP
jgi:uncharacterized protein YjgD (DUF1641 family)